MWIKVQYIMSFENRKFHKDVSWWPLHHSHEQINTHPSLLQTQNFSSKLVLSLLISLTTTEGVIEPNVGCSNMERAFITRLRCSQIPTDDQCSHLLAYSLRSYFSTYRFATKFWRGTGVIFCFILEVRNTF